MPMILPSDPVSSIKGIGAKKEMVLSAIGIEQVSDFLYNYPRTWEDRRNRALIKDIHPSEPVGLTASVISVSSTPKYYAKGKVTPLKLLISDGSGTLEIVFFNSRYMDKIFSVGKEFFFFGTPVQNGISGIQIIHPEFAKADDSSNFFAHPILPVYSIKKGLSQADMRKWHEEAINAATDIIDYLPKSILEKLAICDLGFALTNIHFPTSRSNLSAAKYRLIFEELFLLRVALGRIRKKRVDQSVGVVFPKTPEADDFLRFLPFEMTNAQKKTTLEVYKDMEEDKPMNRLVQGDVGSGKTAVAMAAVYKAFINHYQSVVMVPTEILAGQHFVEFSKLFSKINPKINISLLTSSCSVPERREILAGLEKGEVDLVIGTHAVLQDDVSYNNLGLVITDEQHRFGVNQRIRLAEKGDEPNILVMTATPIPRTLAFILYGDLDVSIIDEMPPGRKSVITKSYNSSNRKEAYKLLDSEINEGRQAYVVAPLIEDNEESEVTKNLRSADSLYTELEKRYSKSKINVALLHGAMKQTEKEEIMKKYAEGTIHILVSTVVIEVGINVPNASIMIIENAERFGLAQLHQLRGRVGRGSAESYCFLISDSETEVAKSRIKTMTETSDGFIIAEKDLELRGPGELFGIRQHGLPELKIADLAKNTKILKVAKEEGDMLMNADPNLEKPENADLREKIESMVTGMSSYGM